MMPDCGAEKHVPH